MYDNAEVSKEEVVTLCCHATHHVRLQQMEYSENDGLYAMYSSGQAQDAIFMRRWLHYFITEVYKSHFKWVGFNYLANKGLDLDLWAESMKDGCHPDFFTLLTLNFLLETHMAVHIKNNKIWMSMDNPLDNHQDLLDRWEYHLVYLGRGIFVELVKRQHRLVIVESNDIKTRELGCLTFNKEETLNSIIYRGLGRAIGPIDKPSKPFIKDIVIKLEPFSTADPSRSGINDEPDSGISEPKIDGRNSNNEESMLGTDPGNLPKTRPKENAPSDSADDWSVPGTDPGTKICIPMDSPGVLATDPGFREIDSTNKPRETVADQGNKPNTPPYPEESVNLLSLENL